MLEAWSDSQLDIVRLTIGQYAERRCWRGAALAVGACIAPMLGQEIRQACQHPELPTARNFLERRRTPGPVAFGRALVV
jgi:hypothetical protein